MKIKVSKPHNVEVKRRVVVATNRIQFYIEELVTVNKLGVWKIVKVFYNKVKAEKAMEALNATH